MSSGLSTITLRYALSFAQESENRLTILSVDDRYRANRANEDWRENNVTPLRAELPGSTSDWPVIEGRVATGEPAQELVRTAHQVEPDLVVVGSTRTAGSAGGLGSVALGALTLTNASVLISVRPQRSRKR